MMSDHDCPDNGGNGLTYGKFKQVDDQHLVFDVSDTNQVWTFDMVSGFQMLRQFSKEHETGGMAVTPRGYAQCQEQVAEPPLE